MATATDRPASRDEKVYHPLDQLRGIIRRYVVIEGVLATLIFLGTWFALALLLDFVVFKTFTWDWVQDGSWWFRLIALVAALLVLAGILVFRILRRLTTEFSYPSLALVLERRYPKVLGDRLITAVEMADVEEAQRYGYSADMIRQTITEARERVGTVDVQAVFNWRRLRLMGVLAIGIPLAVAVIGFAAHAISARDFQPRHAAWKLYHVSTIVGERDLLLWDTPWPRRALLELQGDAKDGLRVARDGAPPRVRVRSYQWVVADRSRPDGWRPLMWNEVDDALIGRSVPAVPFRSLGYQNEPNLRSAGLAAAIGTAAMQSAPDENPEFSTSAADWTVDAIYERAHAGGGAASPGQEGTAPQIARLRARMGEDAFQQLQVVFARLDELAASPSYGRRLRKLERPEAVTFSYTGVKTAGSGTFKPEGNGEYAGEITGLKEDVRFVIKAEDFRTRPKPIVLIPPPTLTRLAQVSFQPAYLHYAKPVDEGYAALRGLRQRMAEERLSLTGDKSIFEVPSGTEVILTGTTEEPIAGAWVVPKVGQIPGAKPGSAAPVALKITDRSRELGTRPLRWSEVTDALLGARVPEFRLPRFLGSSDARSTAVDPAAVVADDVVNWIRTDAGARDSLRTALGDGEFHALERAIGALSPAAAAAVKSASPFEALERALAVLDAKFRDDSGRYVLPLGTTFVLEFTGDFRFVKRAQPYEFDLVYQNLDRVESVRPMLIHVRDDLSPVVELASDVIRRVGNVYYVTPRARIPFVNDSYVKDDNGLSKLEYTYTLYPEDSEIARSMRAALVTRAILPPAANTFPAVVQGVYHAGVHGTLDRGDSRTLGTFLHGGFINREQALKHETKSHLERLLSEPLAGEKIRLVDRYELKWNTYADRTFRADGATLESFKWRMEGDFFDLAALKLEADSSDVQPRYRIDLNVQATDTNYDTGPRTAVNVDPIRLLVVSSGDLLVEIGKEEEVLGAKLDEALAKLRLCRDNYAFVNSKHLIRLPDEIGAVTVKSKTVIQDVAKAKELVLLVGRAFRKIERETVVNNLDDRTIAQYGRFANRIERALGETPMVVSTEEEAEIQTGKSDATPFGALTPRATFPQVEKDLAVVQENLDRNAYADPGQATEADIKLNALEQEITRIRQILGEAQSKDKLIKEARAIIERQLRVRREIQELERTLTGELTKEEPAIGPVGEIFLAKGEAKGIKHSINWRQYKKDDLAVKLTVSEAGALVVPETLKLTFEDHQFDFTYELRATNKEGSYTVTLTPEVGEKVEIKVTVK